MNQNRKLKFRIFCSWAIDVFIFSLLVAICFILLFWLEAWEDQNSILFIESIEENGKVRMKSFYNLWEAKDIIIVYLPFIFLTLISKITLGQWFGGSLGKKIMKLTIVESKKISTFIQFITLVICFTAIIWWFPLVIYEYHFWMLLLVLDILFLIIKGQFIHNYIFGIKIDSLSNSHRIH